MTLSQQIRQILDFARALYDRGAVPEALAIAREVFVSLVDRDDLAELLPDWIASLTPPPGQASAPGAAAALGSAIDALDPALNIADSVRALANLCVVRPVPGAVIAERTLRARHQHERQLHAPWQQFPAAFRSPIIGWEITSPVLSVARQYGLAVPQDFIAQIAQRLPLRERQTMPGREIAALVGAYTRSLLEQGQVQPATRLAVASAVMASAPLSIVEIAEIVRPDPVIRRAADLFDRRGYPTEAANLLVNAIEGSPEADWRRLLQHAERTHEVTLSDRPRGQRSRPPAPSPPSPPPPPPAPAAAAEAPTAPVSAPAPGPGGEAPLAPKTPSGSQPDKSFFFLLKGDQAYKDQVVRGQDADLYFFYDVPTLEALARLESRSLAAVADAAAKGRKIEIGVFIKPVGLTFRDDDEEYKIATIENDALKEKVCFQLQAPDERVDGSGFYTMLTYNGAEVFQAFIAIAIVDAIDRTASTVPPPLAVSRSSFDLNEALPRDVTAFITTNARDGQCRVSLRVGGALPKSAKVLNLAMLESAIVAARATLAEVAESSVFSTMTPARWGAQAGQEPQFLGALCRMMTAGWALYQFLKEAEATQELVQAIESLKDGAKISIFTDSAFIPWEILFPRYFLSEENEVQPDALPDGFEPRRLWGNRFEFETVLMFSNPSQHVQNPLPAARRQPGSLNIRIGVGSVEKAPEPGTPAAEASLNAIVHHRAYCDKNPSIAHWLDGSMELRKAFSDSNYEVSLLYLMCHGRSDLKGEELDFGTYKPVPAWLNPDVAYPGWPVVFINSCSIAGVSPHVFDTFLRRFREKHAFGLVASTFPLPTRFATLFGCAFLDGYRGGTRIGQVLLDLRRRLLEERNPLGFFYVLQCPLDIQAPEHS